MAGRPTRGNLKVQASDSTALSGGEAGIGYSRGTQRQLPEPRTLLRLMQTYRGRIKGDVEFRRGDSSSSAWWNAYCFVNVETASLQYEIDGSSEGFKTLVEDLRGYRIRVATDPRQGQNAICIGSFDSASVILHLRPQQKQYFDAWFAALLCWQPLTLSQSLHDRSSKRRENHISLIPPESPDYFEQLKPDQENRVAKKDSAVLIDGYGINPTISQTKRNVICILRGGGELTIQQEGDSVVVAAFQLDQIPRSAIQRLDGSVAGCLRAMVIRPRYALSVHECSQLRPLCLSFDSCQTFEVWFALLRSCAAPELYGTFDGLTQHDTMSGSNTGTNSAVLRVTQSLHLEIKKAKLYGDPDRDSSTLPSSSSSGGQSRTRYSDAQHYQVAILIESDLVARSQIKAESDGTVFWLEGFELQDIPSFANKLSIRLYRITAGTPSRAILQGEATLPLIALEDHEYQVTLEDLSGRHVAELALDIGYKREHILMEKQYRGVYGYLHDVSNDLTRIMARHVPSSKLSQLAVYLLDIFQATGWVNQWLKHLIEKETYGKPQQTSEPPDLPEISTLNVSVVEDWRKPTQDPSAFILFRGSTLLSKALDAYMRRLGHAYLDETIGTAVRDIADDNIDCEIDPSKLGQGAKLSRNLERLMNTIRQVWINIFGSVSQCPVELRIIFQHIQHCAKTRYGKDMKFAAYTSVSGFLFLRFFCAALYNPQGFGLIDDTPGEHAQRTFTLVAKTLQGLANKKTDFSDKESWMKPMNRFCSDYELQFETFIDSICRISKEAALDTTNWATSGNTTLNAVQKRLSLAGREGCLQLPGLVDSTRSLAALVDLWLDCQLTPDFNEEEDAATTDLLESFDDVCQQVRSKTNFYASSIDHREEDATAISRSWSAIAEEMESNPSAYLAEQDLTDAQQTQDLSIDASPAPIVHTGPPTERPKNVEIKTPEKDTRKSNRSPTQTRTNRLAIDHGVSGASGSSSTKHKRNSKGSGQQRGVEDNALRKLGWM